MPTHIETWPHLGALIFDHDAAADNVWITVAAALRRPVACPAVSGRAPYTAQALRAYLTQQVEGESPV